ncbi:hypothetical protein [Leptolyngbya sp. FACHB-261]|uniref:hypothetical protein n=1 Tax=Leptolyngbya sp. FACHB-261 TaxID=2692806 RepID=UPI0016890B82|nr:hypothetical protein [Leptolyngbya sp. FACHB-261]MBD2099465.1 hypothetical protein [Leptolyngbya sp. FACHB-261]
MDAFSAQPPTWTEKATHARGFQCPTCTAESVEAVAVWLNRRSPVLTELGRRKWQEFYQCRCGCVWWGWSDERPPKEPLRRPNAPE